MLSARALKTWSWLHKWSSLICTVFMLLLCLTGLPLIFHHEIGHLLGTEIEAPEMAVTSCRTRHASAWTRYWPRRGRSTPTASCSSPRRMSMTTASGSSR